MSEEHADEFEHSELLEAWQVAMQPGLTTLEEYLECLQVETKEREVVPFELKPPQRRFARAMQAAWDAGRAYFCMVLKARQVGFSTLMQAIQSEGVERWPGMRGMTVCYDVESVEELFTKVDHFMSCVPPEVRPERRLASRRRIAMRHYAADGSYQESRLSVKTAANTRGGRSYTLHRVHLSEPAFYENLDMLLGLLQTVPNKPGCCVVLEFTANGFNSVKTMWDKAVRGEIAYDTIFVSWLEEPTYVRAVSATEHAAIMRTLDADERLYIAKHGATVEQLAWRRWAIANLCEGHVPSFKQEYPTFPDEAFQSTGRPVFNTEVLASWLEFLRVEQEERVKRGLFVETTRAKGTVVWVESEAGRWELREDPEDGHTYVWGVDSAEGIEAEGDRRREGDASVIAVVDVGTRRCVAEYEGREDLDLVAAEAVMASMRYGKAWGHVELPNQGYAVLTAMRMMGFVFVLFRTRAEATSEGKDGPEKRPGLMMTRPVKNIVIARLVSMVRALGRFEEWKPPADAEDPRPRCPFTLRQVEQMLVYQRDAMGRMGAAPGYHDDAVMALACAQQAVEDSADVPTTPVMGVRTLATLLQWEPDEEDEEYEEAREEASSLNRELERRRLR